MNRSSLPYSHLDLLPKLQAGAVSGSSGSSNTAFTAVNSNTSNKSSIRKFQRYFRRILRPNSLDFETAIWEVFNIIVNPKKMFRSHYYKLQGRASYTRDDPSFLILLTGFLSILAVAWGLAYSPRILDIFKLILYMVLIDFYLFGVIISTMSWLITNKIFNGSFGIIFGDSSVPYKVNYIEWGFCFETHCNAFVIIWGLLYLLQFFLLPILNIRRSVFSLILGNSLYFGAIGYYFVITFYGFISLPFVSGGQGAKKLQMIILAGVLPALVLGWFLTICFGVNVANKMVGAYFN